MKQSIVHAGGSGKTYPAKVSIIGQKSPDLPEWRSSVTPLTISGLSLDDSKTEFLNSQPPR